MNDNSTNFWDLVSDYSTNTLDLIILSSEDLAFLASVGMEW